MTLEEKVEKSSSITTASLAGIIIIALIAGAMVYISVKSAPGIIGFLGAALALVTLAIAVSDWRSYIIPDWLSVAGGGLGLLHAAAQEPGAIVQAVGLAAFRGMVLALSFLALRYVYARYRGRQGLGLGDVKLAFVAGAWLDWLILPIAIQVAVVATLSAYIVRHFVSGNGSQLPAVCPLGCSLRRRFGSAGF